MKSALLALFCQKKSAAVPVDGSMIKARANHFMGKLKIEHLKGGIIV